MNYGNMYLNMPSIQVVNSLRILEKFCDMSAKHVYDNFNDSTDICPVCDDLEYQCLIDLSSKIGHLLSSYSDGIEDKCPVEYKRFIQEIVSL